MSQNANEDARIASILNERTGLLVTSVFDLVNCKKSYSSAISVLIECLPQITGKWVKEGVVRALTVKEAKGKADVPLVREFRRISPSDSEHQGLKWAIGNALAVVATDAVGEDLFELVQDARHGKAREMLVVALGNLKDPRTPDVVIKMLHDEEICGHAIMAAVKLKLRRAIPRIQDLTDHTKPWIRKEAKKALEKLK